MAKNKAAADNIVISIPAGYSIGGRQAVAGTLMGYLSATLDTDNAVYAEQTITYGGVLVATGVSNEWALVVDYNDYVFSSGTIDLEVKPDDEATRGHTISVVSPISDNGGTFTIDFSRVTDSEANTGTESWKLTMLGVAFADVSTNFSIPSTSTYVSGGGADDEVIEVDVSGVTLNSDWSTLLSPPIYMITNPDTAAMYRWLAEEHTSISPEVSDTEYFSDLPGS